MDTDQTFWNILYVAPRTERIVESILSKSGFNVYVPIQKQLRYQKDRRRSIDVVLFNGYVFIEGPVKWVDGIFPSVHIKKMLKFNNKPATILEKDLNMIRQLCLQEEILCFTDHQIISGQRVEILNGVLKGYQAKIEKKQGKTKIFVHVLGLESLGLLSIEVSDAGSYRIMD